MGKTGSSPTDKNTKKKKTKKTTKAKSTAAKAAKEKVTHDNVPVLKTDKDDVYATVVLKRVGHKGVQLQRVKSMELNSKQYRPVLGVPSLSVQEFDCYTVFKCKACLTYVEGESIGRHYGTCKALPLYHKMVMDPWRVKLQQKPMFAPRDADAPTLDVNLKYNTVMAFMPEYIKVSDDEESAGEAAAGGGEGDGDKKPAATVTTAGERSSLSPLTGSPEHSNKTKVSRSSESEEAEADDEDDDDGVPPDGVEDDEVFGGDDSEEESDDDEDGEDDNNDNNSDDDDEEEEEKEEEKKLATSAVATFQSLATNAAASSRVQFQATSQFQGSPASAKIPPSPPSPTTPRVSSRVVLNAPKPFEYDGEMWGELLPDGNLGPPYYPPQYVPNPNEQWDWNGGKLYPKELKGTQVPFKKPSYVPIGNWDCFNNDIQRAEVGETNTGASNEDKLDGEKQAAADTGKDESKIAAKATVKTTGKKRKVKSTTKSGK